MIPRWYGVAWDEWHRREVVCLPLGVNLVAQILRSAYCSIKHGNRAMRANPRAAYDQGYDQALKDVQAVKTGSTHGY